MPTSIVQAFSKQSGKSIPEIEKLWKKAKETVIKNYNLDSSDKRYYVLVTGILKRMLGLKQSKAGEILELFKKIDNTKVIADNIAKIINGKVQKENKLYIITNNDTELILSSTEIKGEAPKTVKDKINKTIKNLVDNINYV